jgi:hypothetical protein
LVSTSMLLWAIFLLPLFDSHEKSSGFLVVFSLLEC